MSWIPHARPEQEVEKLLRSELPNYLSASPEGKSAIVTRTMEAIRPNNKTGHWNSSIVRKWFNNHKKGPTDLESLRNELTRFSHEVDERFVSLQAQIAGRGPVLAQRPPLPHPLPPPAVRVKQNRRANRVALVLTSVAEPISHPNSNPTTDQAAQFACQPNPDLLIPDRNAPPNAPHRSPALMRSRVVALTADLVVDENLPMKVVKGDAYHRLLAETTPQTYPRLHKVKYARKTDVLCLSDSNLTGSQ